MDEYRYIEKIKTTGSTYMCASGLTRDTNNQDMQHVVAMANYAFHMRIAMEILNAHCFNHFKLKIGGYVIMR